MDKQIKVLFKDSVINKCAQKFGVSINNLQFIAGWQNFVYEFTNKNKHYILRVTHESHRSKELLQAEIDWIHYLSKNKVSACCANLSKSNNYIEEIFESGHVFFASVFNKAGGSRINGLEKWNAELIEKCGETTGKIHALSKVYPQTPRKTWRENGYIQTRHKYIPNKYSDLLENSKKVLNLMGRTKKDKETFGLIHGDIHCGNFYVDNGEIVLYDFDECAYSWFIDDIAIQLFYYTNIFRERVIRTEHFMKNFLKGYLRHQYINKAALEQIPLFLKYREIIVMTGVCRSMDLNNLDKYTRCFIDQLSLIGNGRKAYVEFKFTGLLK